MASRMSRKRNEELEKMLVETVLHLRGAGYTWKEIAKYLRRSEKTCKKIHDRARTRPGSNSCGRDGERA